MSILCRLGIHKWEFKDAYVMGKLVWVYTFSRCTRPCCSRYPEWIFCNADPIHLPVEELANKS